MHRVIALALVTAMSCALPAAAQAPQLPTRAPGSRDPALVRAGSYHVEPNHTQIHFTLDHMGFTPFGGTFSQASGSLVLDPKLPSAAKVSIVVPIASVMTTSKKLDEELVSPQFFDAAQFPTATFVSTSVTPQAGNKARIEGTLTLHGVARPVVLDAIFYGAGTNFMSKKPAVGFLGTIVIHRSDFGLTYAVPLVGDEVDLTIDAAFEQ